MTELTRTYEQPIYCKEGKKKFTIYNKKTLAKIAQYQTIADAKSHLTILQKATRNQDLWGIIDGTI